MRRLLPTAHPVDLSDVYADLDLPAQRWVALGMVGAVDGATVVDGRSSALGGAGDLAAFRALRSLADVVVVGLGTAVAEDYRPSWQPRGVEARARRGQPALARLALVTGSGRIPPDLRTLGDPERPPLVITTAAGAPVARERVGSRAEVIVATSTEGGLVESQALVDTLAERGLDRVVVEGGPSLNHTLLAADVVDELFVTIAPVLVGGGRGLVGPTLAGERRLVLHELRVHGSELVCRYRLLPHRAR